MIKKIRISCLILLIGVMTATGCAWDATNQKEEQTGQMTDANTDNLEENEYISEENKKNTYEELANQMMKGDFSGMLETDRISREDAQNVYKNMGEKTEFILVDMNHDGVEDLVWQEKEAREIGKPIIAIFDMNNQGRCEMWDTIDGTEYFFVTEKGNLVYYAPYFGTYCYVPYWKYEYDEAWNRTKIGGICAYDIYDLEELEGHVLEDMEEEGIYFWEYIGEEKVALTRDEFKERFEELTGADYECLVGLSDMSWLQEESSAISNVEESESQEKSEEWIETDEEQAAAKYANNGNIEVTIERIDKSVYDEQGRVIATIYYDKPVVLGDTEAVAKMNSFFENEVQSFIGNGESRYISENAYESFSEDIEFMKERYGTDSLAEHPITYVIKHISEKNKKNAYEELASQMMEGDFSGMLETDHISRDDAQNVYKNMGEKTEFILVDMNHDGVEDLVWQEKEEGTGMGKPILGIFNLKNQGECVLWDTMDGGEYYFVTEKENLIYYSQYFGIYCYASYEKVDCDEEWNQVLEKGLYSYDIYDVDEVLFWFDEHDHTDMTQNGVYFKMYADGVEKTITKDEYKIEFEKLTQRKFEELLDLPDRSWLNDSDD